jgi:hypothetical protein
MSSASPDTTNNQAEYVGAMERHTSTAGFPWTWSGTASSSYDNSQSITHRATSDPVNCMRRDGGLEIFWVFAGGSTTYAASTRWLTGRPMSPWTLTPAVKSTTQPQEYNEEIILLSGLRSICHNVSGQPVHL